METRKFVEWASVISGLIANVVVLVFCGWRIQVASEMFAKDQSAQASQNARAWNEIAGQSAAIRGRQNEIMDSQRRGFEVIGLLRDAIKDMKERR